ncbi:hypothetical protein M758_6G198100 [Ceratodon purpureus]|nr:hypothetical protein M758_6G198100 [Ceratodon purpureus]
MTKTNGVLGRPAAHGHCMGAAAATWRARHYFEKLVLLWILLDLVHVVRGQSIEFTVKPPGYSNVASPTFQFTVVAGANGVNPCATQQCSFQCQLDQNVLQPCSGGTYSAFNLSDTSHILTVNAYSPNGTLVLAPSMYSWTVDTKPPTATLSTNSLFTSAINITVNVTFSEECSGGRTFQCTNTACDLIVRGPALAYPSTLVIISPGIAYSLQVGLSTLESTGKVTLTTPRDRICADAAGNNYQRSPNSTIVVRFSRIQPTLNLWTPITNSQVVIGDQARTVQATKTTGDVPIYLDFSEPIRGTGAELQTLLTISHGLLFPLARKSRGNSRFAFSLRLNNTGTVAVTVTLPGNSSASRYGVRVLETARVSFLHDVDRPQVLLSSTARAHTRNQLLPVLIQFTKPVFTFNNSGVTLTGGVVRSFREITKTTYALVVYALDSSIVGISVTENRTVDIAGNPNVASSMLQIKHYSSTPAISIALYSFITAGILGTAFFSGALAISSANLAAAGAIFGRPGSCIGADASKNLLGMAGHMQVLALTSFLAVSLPIEYYETANGLQWLIPHVSTPWQKNEDVNYTTTFAANVQTNLTLSVRRSMMTSASHVPSGVGELRLQALFSACRMMRQWPTQYDNMNCSLYSESLATTYWSGTYMEDFLPRNQVSYLSRTQDRRRLGANGTEFGPAMTAEEYTTYFLNQGASLSRLQKDLLERKYTGWSDFWRNIFWILVVCGSLILLHILLLLFLRWRTKTPLHGALSIPRFELFLLILVLPAICQASAFVIRGGTKAGIAVGVLLLIIPVVLLLMTVLLLVFGIFLGKRVQYKELRPHPQEDGKPRPPPTRMPLSLITGAGYPGRWARKESTSLAFIPRYGILFEDRKGPPRLVTMINDSSSSQKSSTRSGFRRNTMLNSDDEHDERAVSRAYTLSGCFQSAYILVDISRRIALGLIFGAFRVTDESWTQVSLAIAVTAVQLLYLVIAKPFQRRFVQFVETVSLLCEIGIFVAAMVILAQNRPYDGHFGIGVVMLALLVLSFVAQIANEWFALIRQLLALSNTEEISPKEGLKAFAIGLFLPLLPRSRWPQFNTATVRTAPPTLKPPPPPRNLDVDQRASTSGGQYYSSPLTSPRPDNGTATQSPRSPVFGSVTKSQKPVVSTTEYWPGEDLQEWARQNSMERRRQETELVVNPMVQEIASADPIFTKYLQEAPTSTAVSKSRQRRSRIHSDSGSTIVLSDGESEESSHSRQHSIEIGPALP